MPIKDPLPEGMPRSQTSTGVPPARNNFVAAAIAQVWYEIETGQRDPITVTLNIGKHGGGRRPLAIPDAGPFRASTAGTRCDRAAYYAIAGVDETNPPTIADTWRMATGTMIHDVLEGIAEVMFADNPDVTDIEVEPVFDLRPFGLNGSGHGDILLTYKGVRTAVEVKTVGGFKFKLAASTFKGPPEGPSHGNIMQGLLAAKALGAEQLVIAYISLENLGKNMKVERETDRFAAEWHYDMKQLEGLFADEIDRYNMLIDRTEIDGDDDALPARELRDHEVPAGAIVTKPETGAWVVLDADGDTIVDTGKTWMCGYCRHQDRCAADGAGS